MSRVARLMGVGLLLALAACARSCSCRPEVERDDAGDASFVRQAVPKLLGRKVRGTEEVRLLSDIIAATGGDRLPLLRALMSGPEFVEHWTSNLQDFLRVDRDCDADRPPGTQCASTKEQSACLSAPLRPATDGSVADLILSQPATDAASVAPFNLTDVLRSSVIRDNVYPAYAAYLFALQARPLAFDGALERNRRDDLATTFGEVYLNRRVSCLACHNSRYSTSGPQSGWNRTHPVFGRFEKALFESDFGQDERKLPAMFRTGVNSPPPGVNENNPQGSDPDPRLAGEVPRRPWGSMQGCGQFVSGVPAPRAEPADVVPHLTRDFPAGGSIWDVYRRLDEGRQTIAREGLIRRLHPDCLSCRSSTCPAPAPLPAGDVAAQARRDRVADLLGVGSEPRMRCAGCHSADYPSGGLDLHTAAGWEERLINRLSRYENERFLVKPGDAARSFLYQKLTGDLTAAEGVRMPQGGPYWDSDAPGSDRAALAEWINRHPASPLDPRCGVCGTQACRIPLILDGPAALAALTAATFVDRAWSELFGSRLTIANSFPRNLDAKLTLWTLTESEFLPGWSLKRLLEKLLTSEYFNRKSPQDTTAGPPYNLPMLHDPWVEADPRYPPASVPGYRASEHPESHRNATSEAIHRYSPASLLVSVHRALGWPAPPRFYGASYPSYGFVRAFGQFVSDVNPGLKDVSFQSLLAWERAVGTCRNPVPGARDWLDGYVDRVAAYNASSSTPLGFAEMAQTVKDRLLSVTSLELGEATSFVERFGPLDARPNLANADEKAATVGKLRDFCAVLLKSPQFLLAGLAPTGVEPLPPRLLGPACDPAAPCDYRSLCRAVAPTFADQSWVLDCDATPVTARFVPRLRGLSAEEVLARIREVRELCPSGTCAFLTSSTQQAAASGVPDCDVRCQGARCCGRDPADAVTDPTPGVFLAWAEGAKVRAARGVKLLRGPDGANVPAELKAGGVLAAGDLLEIPSGATLELQAGRAELRTPEKGMTPPPQAKAWLLQVTGPSALLERERLELIPVVPAHDSAWLSAEAERRRADTLPRNANDRARYNPATSPFHGR